MWLYYYSTVECKRFIHAAAALLLVLSRSARDWVGRGCCWRHEPAPSWPANHSRALYKAGQLAERSVTDSALGRRWVRTTERVVRLECCASALLEPCSEKRSLLYTAPADGGSVLLTAGRDSLSSSVRYCWTRGYWSCWSCWTLCWRRARLHTGSETATSVTLSAATVSATSRRSWTTRTTRSVDGSASAETSTTWTWGRARTRPCATTGCAWTGTPAGCRRRYTGCSAWSPGAGARRRARSAAPSSRTRWRCGTDWGWSASRWRSAVCAPPSTLFTYTTTTPVASV